MKYETLPRRGGRFAFALAASLLSSAEVARAQSPPPTLPPARMPTMKSDSDTAPPGVAAPKALDATVTFSDLGVTPSAYPSEKSLGGTICESLFGDASAEGKWRPLTLDTFFSDGWFDPWAGGPAGQEGLTPRHGWLGAFEGVFYRLGLVNTTYQHDVNKPFGGQAYGSNFTAFLPMSRRFELYFNAPFISSNGTEDPTKGYQTDFGDLQIAGSFLLSESEACTQLFTFGVTVPTGRPDTGGGLMAVNPRYSFWSNPGGAWVVRGGAGVNVPLNKDNLKTGPASVLPTGELDFGESTAQTAFNGDLAVGRYFTPHNVPFGDLVLYFNSNIVVPLEDSGKPTYVGVGPGTRFQITGNWYFLNYWEFQVGKDRPFEYQIQTAVVKAW